MKTSDVKQKQDEYVLFNSWPEYWEKEKSGAKPNTFRKVDEKDDRFIRLRNAVAKKIIVFKGKDSGHFFIREITDYTEFDGWAIISWKHEGSA